MAHESDSWKILYRQVIKLSLNELNKANTYVSLQKTRGSSIIVLRRKYISVTQQDLINKRDHKFKMIKKKV